MFQQGDWAFSLDLKSGYHHIDIREDSQTMDFLGVMKIAVRTLASVVGQVIFMSLALGPIICLRTRVCMLSSTSIFFGLINYLSRWKLHTKWCFGYTT